MLSVNNKIFVWFYRGLPFMSRLALKTFFTTFTKVLLLIHHTPTKLNFPLICYIPKCLIWSTINNWNHLFIWVTFRANCASWFIFIIHSFRVCGRTYTFPNVHFLSGVKALRSRHLGLSGHLQVYSNLCELTHSFTSAALAALQAVRCCCALLLPGAIHCTLCTISLFQTWSLESTFYKSAS